MNLDEIRAFADASVPRVRPDGSINPAHVAIESTLRHRHGHPGYVAELDGPGRYRPVTNLDELVQLAERARADVPPPREIRLARDLYERVRAEAHERFTHTTPSLGSSAYGIPLVVDDELAPGEHRVVPGEPWWSR